MYAFNIRPFEQIIDTLYTEEKRLNMLIFLFSFIAVFLSLMGVFGLAVYECQYRRKEIALRKILGSTSREIMILFNKTYIRILTVSFLPAVPVASYSTRLWLENFAYKTPMHYWVYAISFLFILAITSLVVTLQCRHAANSNPVKSLKTE
jgi:putative ABC transport system permease protein